MPDVRLDAISDALTDLQSDWSALVIATKASPNPRDTVDMLDAGVINVQAQISNITASLMRLPTKDIAIDLHTLAS